MGEWDFLGGLFKSLQDHSPMLGRFWLFLMLVFRIVILGTVASDLFEDEQEEFACNTLQPGCKQVCYDQAFPISQYRFWVFHIVLIATPSMIFLMYAMHHSNKKATRPQTTEDHREERRFRRLYIVNVAFRIVAEIGFLVGQWLLYGFKVEAQFPCSRFPCPYTVDCFTSRPAEKTIFLCFYFIVGVIAAISSCLELFYSSFKWFCSRQSSLKRQHFYVNQNLHNMKQEGLGGKSVSSAPSTMRLKKGSQRSNASRKVSSHKSKGSKYVSNRTFMV